MTAPLLYWHVIAQQGLRADKHNPRVQERIRLTEPGRLLTSDGVVILDARRTNGEWYMEYPEPEVFCHLTGYNSRTGLQGGLQAPLFGLGRYQDPWRRILRGRGKGCDVQLTISGEMQRLAAGLMGGRRGAVVALDPKTGGILCMVSSPGYDPTQVLTSTEDFESFRKHPDQVELNRALQGQYPPGSVLKVFTAAAALDAGTADPDDRFSCDGAATIAGDEIRCRLSRGHGRIDFTRAFADSCNIAFAEMGVALGGERFRDYADRFFLLEGPTLPLPAKGGRMSAMVGLDAQAQVAEAAFGQGATLLSPVSVARLAATIANRGQVPQLQIVEQITGPDGESFETLAPAMLGQAVSSEVAETVAGMMVETVERGTGRSARMRGIEVAGKTGSAETPTGRAHAWFAGFAPADEPRVAVAVVVENGGSGGSVAAPIARRVMREALNAGRD